MAKIDDDNIFEDTSDEYQETQQAEDNSKKETVALQLVEEIKREKMLFFHNEQKEGFVSTRGDGSEVFKIRSRAFRQYLSHHIYKKSGLIVRPDTINTISQVLEGQAIFDGKRYELSVRIAFSNKAVWYDLGGGPVVHIDKDGWTISDTPPILFSRYTHQQTQTLPKHGGNIWNLCNFINLKTDEERLLFLVFTVAAFIPGFSHPLLVLHGPQGSGKTTPERLLKLLIDPSALKVLSAPDSMREFAQIASHHYFLFFDNMSSLSDWMSDSLSKAVTGDGFSKRELFSDDDDIIYNFQRVLALNGINLVVQRADLLERSILLGLERISKKERREEQEFWNEFEKKKPFILGAIFDAVSEAISIYPSIEYDSRPRMADFTRWGCAIAEAIGSTKKEFITAYENNIAKQNKEAIDANPVAMAVLELMETEDKWEGTATELFTELEKHAIQLKINLRGKAWPKDPSALSRKLHVAQTNLAEEGIQVTRDETVRPKRVTIQRVQENGDKGDNPTRNRKDKARNDMPGSGEQTFNPNINADNENQPQFDGMTGLSGLSPKEQLKEGKADETVV